ncbi:MAG: hypothetical protein RIS64_954 [Bacteroidota bacterium]|jgi:hypothetical protein
MLLLKKTKQLVFSIAILTPLMWSCNRDKPAPKSPSTASKSTIAPADTAANQLVTPPNAASTPAIAPMNAVVIDSSTGGHALDDCTFLNQWFKNECDSLGTRFACTGKEKFIVEENADEEWCSGVGYLRVKVLFRQEFVENGAPKMVLLAGMMPESKWENAKFSETLVGASIWAKQKNTWKLQNETKMVTFLQSNIRKPMQIQYVDAQKQIEVRYKEGKTDQVLRIGLKNGQFMPLDVSNQ